MPPHGSGAPASTQAPLHGNNFRTNYVKPSVLLISISGHGIGWSNALRRLALRPTLRPSASAYSSAMTLATKRPYGDISPVSNRTHVIGYGCIWADDHHPYRRLLKWRSGMTTPITAHASSNHQTDNVNEATNRRSTQANDEDNGGLPETSTHRRNDHQDTRRKAKEVQAIGLTISRPTGSHPIEAKDSNQATDSRLKGSFRATVLYVAKLATGLLIVRSVGACRPYLLSRCNPPRTTTLSRETECWATHHWS